MRDPGDLTVHHSVDAASELVERPAPGANHWKIDSGTDCHWVCRRPPEVLVCDGITPHAYLIESAPSRSELRSETIDRRPEVEAEAPEVTSQARGLGALVVKLAA